MTKKRKKTDDFTLLKLKLEVIEELGLEEKIKKLGWGGLTAEETGKMGGHITSKIRALEKEEA
ncbi:MAG: small, acid-soluble spore protein, alpha/beta type [Halanaerobiaceae bacterium]|nr:small, acid-soluble spore protein, alpha/beta type [Halanaerobiaceae bacterium]